MTPKQIETKFLIPLAEMIGKPKGKLSVWSQELSTLIPKDTTEEKLENLCRRLRLTLSSFPRNVIQLAELFKVEHQPIDGPVGPKGRYVDYADKGKRDDADWNEGVAICRGTELGAQSVREHWSPALLQFAVANKRLPKGVEIDECKTSGLEGNAMAKNSENGGISQAVIGWRLAMLTKCAADFGFEFPGKTASG